MDIFLSRRAHSRHRSSGSIQKMLAVARLKQRANSTATEPRAAAVPVTAEIDDLFSKVSQVKRQRAEEESQKAAALHVMSCCARRMLPCDPCS
jgi:hypothetical protein